MAVGKVKFFDPEKGFGFIVPDDGTPDLFMHGSKIQADVINLIAPEATVSYEVVEHRGKRSATNVTLVAPAPPKVKPTFKPAPKPELDFEEEFEREWGLRRAP
jgi:Cold shock proteins